MSTPCAKKISVDNKISEKEGDQLLMRLQNLAKLRADREGTAITKALKDIAGEIKQEEQMLGAIHQRNALLTIKAKRDVKDFARRFKTLGDGLLTFLEGSSKRIPGARLSVDYQMKSLYGKYFGGLIARLEKTGTYRDFKTGKNSENVYREMGALGDSPVTQDKSAQEIAKNIDATISEAVARQNRAGAYITKAPLYDMIQSHDQQAIRALGRQTSGTISKEASFRAWRATAEPLLDMARTTQGADANKVLRDIHEQLYSGVYGIPRDELNVSGITIEGNMAKRISRRSTLSFKDADSAYQYNQTFGIRDLKESVLNDLHQRTKSIALMENFGPTPESTFKHIVRELEDEARKGDDPKQVESLKTWALEGAFNTLTGRNDIPQNVTMHRFISNAKVLLQLGKMGMVTLSSFADKAFMQSEMAFQGMSKLDVLGKQLTGMFKRTKDQEQTLRLMGVAMDGLMGNAMSRYSSNSGLSGWAHTAQKWFFDLNLLNSWTDANKATAAELMSAHLGENSHLKFDDLQDNLRHVLTLYDISRTQWDALRSTAYVPSDRSSKFITPDRVAEIPADKMMDIVRERGLLTSPANILRERDKLETALRTYLADRVDIAIPTPGANERRWATMNTQAGTPLGEAVRLVTLFKSFPLTIMDKVLGREIYGRGADTAMQWLLNDHRGKFNLAMLMAMGTAAGYLSGSIRDALKGKEPKSLTTPDGGLNWDTVNDAALRGGTLGILGDVLLQNFSAQHQGFLSYAAGPVLGQADQFAQLMSNIEHGGPVAQPTGKLLMDNAPFMNLFYVRPVLDYFILWNLQEMLSPGTQLRREAATERRGQSYFLRPSETVQ